MSPCVKEDPWFQWVFKFWGQCTELEQLIITSLEKFPVAVLASVINALKAHC